MIHTVLAATEEVSGIGALGIDPLAIVAQAATFLVLFVVIKKFALGKIVQTLEERRKTINRGLHLTSEMDKLKADLDARVESALRDARKEADGILNEAKKESGEIIRAAEEAASRKADAILADAQGKIARDIEAARSGLRKEVALLVADATEAILEQKLDSSSDKQLIEKYVNGASK